MRSSVASSPSAFRDREALARTALLGLAIGRARPGLRVAVRARRRALRGMGGAVGDDQRDAKLVPGSACPRRAGSKPVAKERGLRDRGPLAMPPGPPMAATPGARVGVVRFDQAQPDQSPVLIDSLDRVEFQLEFADHGRWGVKPSPAQRGKRHRPLTSTTQLLKRQTMLSLNERHRTELSILRPRRSRLLTLPLFLGHRRALAP